MSRWSEAPGSPVLIVGDPAAPLATSGPLRGGLCSRFLRGLVQPQRGACRPRRPGNWPVVPASSDHASWLAARLVSAKFAAGCPDRARGHPGPRRPGAHTASAEIVNHYLGGRAIDTGRPQDSAAVFPGYAAAAVGLAGAFGVSPIDALADGSYSP